MTASQFSYCPHCRAELQTRRIPADDGPERRVCGACGFIEWGNSKPSGNGIVVDERGRILLARRAIDPGRGRWYVPGGFLEPGEHPADGAVREVREETGLIVHADKLLGIYMDVYGDTGYHTLNVHYVCSVAGGALRPADDVDAAEWFAADAVPRDLAFENNEIALRDWRRLQEKHGSDGK